MINPNYLQVSGRSTCLKTPTYDKLGQACHPSVYRSRLPWNGFPYWMAMTPYPRENLDYENPSILASLDGDTWVVPDVENPLVPKPEGGYNSDPDLVCDGTTMWLFFRASDGKTFDQIYVIISTNGREWSHPIPIVSGSFRELLSPAVVLLEGKFVMFTVNALSSTRVLERRTAATARGVWSSPTISYAIVPEGHQLWHLGVTLRHKELYAFMNLDAEVLWLYESVDGGYRWQGASLPLLERSNEGWDSGRIYRGSGTPTDTGFRLWYSGSDIDNNWHIGSVPIVLKFN